MPGRGFDVEETKFYSQAIEKENLQRLQWFAKHGSHLIEGLKLELEITPIEKPDEEEFNDFKSDKSLEKEREETTSNSEVILETMKPIPNELREVLYTGHSYIDEGRKKYMKLRNLNGPRDKFYYKECRSWDYGWFQSPEDLLAGDRRGRVNVVKESFYRRNGVEKNPPHYMEPVNAKAPFPLPLP